MPYKLTMAKYFLILEMHEDTSVGLISLDIKWLTTVIFEKWCPHTDSNRGPIDYKSMKLLFLVDTTEKYINTLDTTEYYVYTLPDTINILFLCDLL